MGEGGGRREVNADFGERERMLGEGGGGGCVWNVSKFSAIFKSREEGEVKGGVIIVEPENQYC